MKEFFLTLLTAVILIAFGFSLFGHFTQTSAEVSALKPIVYSAGVDELMSRYRTLTINAIDEDNKNCVVVYKVVDLDGGTSVSITNELGEEYTGEELLTLRIATNKAYYIAFKPFEDNAFSNVRKTFSILLNLVEFELDFGATVNHSINATNLFTAYTEDGAKLTNYSITFDIAEKGEIENV